MFGRALRLPTHRDSTRILQTFLLPFAGITMAAYADTQLQQFKVDNQLLRANGFEPILILETGEERELKGSEGGGEECGSGGGEARLFTEGEEGGGGGAFPLTLARQALHHSKCTLRLSL